jgi:hypothetical protein
MTTLAQDITKAMGFQKINLNVIDIEKRINDSKRLPKQYRGLVLAKIGKTIRQERMIRVCSVCKRYEIDGEWIESIGFKVGEITLDWIELSIPPGQQTHGYCPVCYDQAMKEIETLREQHDIVEELER